MRAERGFFAQFRAVLPVLVRLYVPPLLVLGSVALLAARGVIGTGRLTHDPNHLADLPPYTGAISQIGALLWCAAASICFFSSRLLAGSPARFLRCAGLLTTVLLVDDMFLVHDQVFPQYFGLHQQLPIVAYALAMVALLVGFRRTILQTEYVILALALLFFGLSAILDLVPVTTFKGHNLTEEGLKLLGIVSWLGYFWRTSHGFVADQRPRAS